MKKISGNSNIRLRRRRRHDRHADSGQRAQPRRQAGPGAHRAMAPTQADAKLNFTVKGGNALPPNSTVTWKGTLTVPHAGNYWIYLQALGTNANISIDGKRLAGTGAFQGGVHGDILQANQDNVIPTTDGLDNVRRAVELTAGAARDRSQDQPRHFDCAGAGAAQLVHARAAQGRSRSRHRRREERQSRGGLCVDAPRARLRPARRPEQAGRGSRRRQSQHRRRAQHQPASGAAVGRQGEGGARNVVAGR